MIKNFIKPMPYISHKNIPILVIEDNEGDWFLLREYLKEYFDEQHIDNCFTIASAEKLLQQNKYAIVFLDLTLPDSGGNESIDRVNEFAPETPIIVLTGYEDQAYAVETLKKGVQDYLLKDEISAMLLLKSINYSIERHKNRLAFRNTEIQKRIEISDAVINAQEKERLMLSSELHDNINQILACSSMFLGMAELKNDKKKEYVKQANELLLSAINEIRELSHSLAPPNFKGLHFELALEKLLDKFTTSSGILVNTNWEKDSFSAFSEKILLNVFRIIQEQLNNINKHARAKCIEIVVEKKQNNLYLSIRDDGIGFDSTTHTDGIGIYNIKTRASIFNGSAEFITAPLHGCILNVVLTDMQYTI